MVKDKFIPVPDSKPANMNNCKTCGVEMNTNGGMFLDCGGDCQLCMAKAGDPACVKAVLDMVPLILDSRDKGWELAADLQKQANRLRNLIPVGLLATYDETKGENL